MMNRMLAMHTSPNTTALPRAGATTDDIQDRINDLGRMYNPEADNGNDHSDNDEAGECNDRSAKEHAALAATESLSNRADRRTEPHTQGAVPTEATPRGQRACRTIFSNPRGASCNPIKASGNTAWILPFCHRVVPPTA